jgi:hypothetical protein
MKRLCGLSALLIISTLFVPTQARSIAGVLEKTKLTRSQTNALLQFMIHQGLNPEVILIEPLINRDSSPVKLISSMRPQTLGFLLQLVQATGKLDRAYTHTKTRSLVNLARNYKRLREHELDSSFTVGQQF